MSLTFDEFTAKAAAFKTADAEAKQKANEKASLQAELIAYMEENSYYQHDGGTFTLTYKAAYETHGLDTKALKAVAADLWETYPKVSTHNASITLTIKNTVS